MFTDDYKWNFDYVRLAWDTGFKFENHKTCALDKSKICLVDIDQVVRDRDFGAIERHISTVIQYVLDNEQAEVLDTNFVKMFRISQLAVEYLLFCKKYLDNTTVLLKKEMATLSEENKELKAFNRELEDHIEVLTSKIDNFRTSETHKCTKCYKMFSTDAYLKAHIKRRHTVYDDNSCSTQSDADKLQSEIKNLKERLNNTEKLIFDKNLEDKQDGESMEKGDGPKVKEIQENFERFKNQVENELKVLQMQKSFYEEKYGKLIDVVSGTILKKPDEKIDSTTQTEKREKRLSVEVFQGKNVADCDDEVFPTNIEVTIEKKVSEGLEKIEGQMQMFLSKLNDFEASRMVKNEPVIVVPKPRSKFTMPSVPIEIEPDILVEEPQKLEESESESETIDSDSSDDQEVLVKPSTNLVKVVENDEIFDELRKEVQNVINTRLQDIGISPDWKTIPKKTYEKSMEIIQHRAALTAKSYPDFEKIRQSLERDLSRKIKDKTLKTEQILRFSLKKKESPKRTKIVKTSPTVTIKNRSLYETDSDSEKPSQKFTQVINELKTVLPKSDTNQTKSVLKNYPSMGNLAKKKVIFDIQPDKIKNDSTDSIHSSVFDKIDEKSDDFDF